MIKSRTQYSGLFLALLTLLSCGGERKKETNAVVEKNIAVPVFNRDSAWYFVKAQVDFGPRVPNSIAHRMAGDYLINQLKKYGAALHVQPFEATTFDGKKLKLRNIIASFNPAVQKRIALASHWDTRPFADKDKEHPDAPFDGANDGASGVGVLLEIARQLAKMPAEVGVDIILFDGEDWGEKDKLSGKIPTPEGLDAWWCLGSQYWSKHKHVANYVAYYGILLDMVGAKGAHFYREGTSQKYAPKIVDKVWSAAERLGYAAYFIKQDQGGILDDHVFVNQIANIPMIDLVDYQPDTGYFGDYHHSVKDNMDIISKESLGATGAVLMDVIYRE